MAELMLAATTQQQQQQHSHETPFDALEARIVADDSGDQLQPEEGELPAAVVAPVAASSLSASSSSDHIAASFHTLRVAPAAPSSHGLSSPPEASPAAAPPASSSSSSAVSSASSSPAPISDAISASSSSHVAAAPAPVPAVAATPSPAPLEMPAMRELPLIKLGRTPKERTLYEQLGDLYSLIVTTEHLESAYVRDAITEQAYTSACSKLIAQYKTLRESMGASAPDLEAFGREYGLECRAGENRLRVGVPATVVHGASLGSSGPGADNNKKMEVAIFTSVQHFITMMDQLKLNMRAVDELHPTLNDLVESVGKVPNLPVTHESRTKPVAWLTTLHQMKAHEELTEEQCRQMSFDLDSAYSAFHKYVSGK